MDKTVNELMSELHKILVSEDKAYNKALDARSDIEKDAAIALLIDHREQEQPFLRKTIVPCPQRGLTDGQEDGKRKLGYLELSFERSLIRHHNDPSEFSRTEVLKLVAQLEVKRRVEFLYDLQKLRIQNNLRVSSSERLYGIKDNYLDHSGNVLEKLEHHNIQMVDRILKNSPDGEFYRWLIDTHLGVGPQMAGCIISGFSAPERFRTVSALWAYCGLHVKNGKAARREVGQTANWNNFLKTKLLGVLPGCMLKAQTRHIGTEREITDARNVKTLNDYKHRLIQKNEMIKERYYDEGGDEIFHYRSDKFVKTKDGEVVPSQIPRKSLAHIHAMSQRYMIKMFLCDVLNKWREFKGMEPLKTYDEVMLRDGVPHGGFR